MLLEEELERLVLGRPLVEAGPTPAPQRVRPDGKEGKEGGKYSRSSSDTGEAPESAEEDSEGSETSDSSTGAQLKAYLSEKQKRFRLALTAKEKRLIRTSWQKMQQHNRLRDFAKAFYAAYFLRHPAAQRLFEGPPPPLLLSFDPDRWMS